MNKNLKNVLAGAVVGVVISAGQAIAQQQPARAQSAEKSGLAAMLADDEKVMAELSRRDLTTLQEYMFARDKIPPEQQATYKAVASLKMLNSGTPMKPRQQMELIHTISLGIDKVLTTMNDPAELMKLARALVTSGTARPVNVLEYFGENPRTQSQLRPIADATVRVYQKAIESAQKKADKIANEMTPANQNTTAPQWEKAMQLVGLAKFSLANARHVQAIAYDRADPKRVEAAQDGIKILTEYEDPQYEIVAPAKLGIAKLNLDIGTPEALDAARKKFADVLAEKSAGWAQKFEAIYFTAVCDVVGKNFDAARKGGEAVAKWLDANKPQDPTDEKGARAALKMLDYRIAAAEAEAAGPTAQAAANAKAIAALQDLLKDRPDLTGIINEQLISKLPEQPEVGKLDPLLLKAIVAKGNDQVVKPAGEPVDKKVLTQAILAAREVVGRMGKDASITPEDVEKSTLLLAFFQQRLDQHEQAALTFLGFLDKYKNSPNVNLAFENALSEVARLKRDNPPNVATDDIYARFLSIATAPPFNRVEFNAEYGRLLLERNIDSMKGNYNDAQREQMLAAAEKAANLFAAMRDPKREMSSRFFEMLAYDQMIDLVGEQSPKAKEYGSKIEQLAKQVNAAADGEIAAGDAAAKNRARSMKVRTALLVANLLKDQTGPGREAALQRAMGMLASFEQDVQGLPNAQDLIGQVLFIRVNALLSLGKTDEALESLGKYIETRKGDDSIRIVFDMLEALNKDYEQAEHEKNEARMAELAANRAKVSGYLVQRVSQSKNPELTKYLPKYRMFEANALQKAALLEKDASRKRGFLERAMKIYQDELAKTPDDRGLQLAVALVQYDMGDYAPAQKVLAEMFQQKLLGRPLIEQQGPDGPRLVPNNAYWDALYKLSRANVELSKAKAPGSEEMLSQTQQFLKELYITYPEPGGARWGPQFDALRQEILPDWTPPTSELAAQTQPAAK